MKGLLLKDWYMILKYGKFYLVFHLLYAVIAAFSGRSMIVFVLMNVILGSMIVKTLMAYEEQNKWDNLVINLPVTVREIVVEKYLMGFGGAMFANVVTFLAMWIVKLIFHRNVDIPLLPFFFLYIALGMLYLAFQLPVLFKYGTANGRFVYMIIIAVVAGISGGLSSLLVEEMPGVKTMPGLTPVVVAAVFVAAAAGVMLSVKLSVFFYRKREF